MNIKNNTGLGLIKTTIERVQNDESLFGSALKKLVNSTEEELSRFLRGELEVGVRQGVLRLISGGRELRLRELKGSRYIIKSRETFKSYIDPDFEKLGNRNGAATPKTLIQVHEMVANGTVMDMFGSIPGTWEEKWLSQDQVVEFCQSLYPWLRQDGYGTFFLIRKDERKPVNEAHPEENLAVVRVYLDPNGLKASLLRLESDAKWFGEMRHHVVSPRRH